MARLGTVISSLAELVYGTKLAHDGDGRAHLPAIRREEVLRAGKILGVRKHFFLDQKDLGFRDHRLRMQVPRTGIAPGSASFCSSFFPRSAMMPFSRCSLRRKRMGITRSDDFDLGSGREAE